MIREIHLHGALGEHCGRVHRLAVDSPAEAIRGVCSQFPGARGVIESSSWAVIRGPLSGAKALAAHQLRAPLGADCEELHLVPQIEGADDGFGQIILGTLLIAASFFIPGAGLFGAGIITASSVATVGASLLIGGVAAMLAPKPKAEGRVGNSDETSSLFGDQINNARPGAPIPVLFGESEVGSVVVSGAVRVERRA